MGDLSFGKISLQGTKNELTQCDFFFQIVFLIGIKSIGLKGQLPKTIQNLELSRDTQYYIHYLTQ